MKSRGRKEGGEGRGGKGRGDGRGETRGGEGRRGKGGGERRRGEKRREAVSRGELRMHLNARNPEGLELQMRSMFET